MSSTRSPFPPARAIELLIVSHGSPSDPEPQEAFVWSLAHEVAKASGAKVRGATLAKKGALEEAVRGFHAPLVFPHFMADGWFVSTNLQNRLGQSGLDSWTTLPPLGLTPGLPHLAHRRLTDRMLEAELPPGRTTLVLAAHGSPSDPRPAEATKRFGKALQETGLFSEVRLGFVDEEPALEEAARVDGPALVLPFFAAQAGHVLNDLPEALEAARFTGPVLEPIGTWEEIPDLIAKTLKLREKAA